MRRLAAALAALLGSAPAAGGGGWELEVSLGGAGGPERVVSAPFEFQGASVGGPFRLCGATEQGGFDCALVGDRVEFSLLERYQPTGLVGLDVRRRLGGSLWIGAGGVGGLSPRKQRLYQTITFGNFTSLPVAPEPLARSIVRVEGSIILDEDTAGVEATLYLRGTLRWERGFEHRTPEGGTTSPVRVFADAGGGVFPMLPGTPDSSPGIHFGAGVRFGRESGNAWTFSVQHLRTLRDVGGDSAYSWTLVRVGRVFAR
jgi:hypothetical protein